MTARRNITTRSRTRAVARAARAFVLDVVLSLVIWGLAVPAGYVATTVAYVPAIATAQSFGAGYQKYQKGDFQGAQAAFNAALKKKPGKAEAARIYKYLGVSQYMLGNKGGSSASFKNALKLNPALALTNSEVLDDSVIPFFNGHKPKKAAGPAAVAPTAAKPAPKSVAAGQSKLASGKLKQTFLKVASNVPNAQVFVDGIIAGPVNALINTDPGSVLVEVQAKGYVTRKVNVTITANAENNVTVNLLKPKPKPKPKPVAKLKPKPKAQQKYAKKPVGKGKKGFGGNLYTPTPDDDMFAGDGGGSAGTGASGADLASEFAMDSGSGYGAPAGYGAPPPGYGAPPPGYGAPPPGYGAPPGYAAPPAYGYAPPPPAYGYGYAPPPPAYGYAPPPPPPPDPGGYADPYGAPPAAAIPADPGGGGDPGPGAPADPSADEDSDGGGSTDGLFIKLLPFGAGQFYNGSFMLGLLFAGAEAGGIYVYMSKTKSANDAAAATNAYIAANKDNSVIQDDEEERLKYEKFIADSKKYVEGERKSATMGMIAFGALWGIGVVESILNGKPKKKKKKKKRKYSPFGLYGPAEDDQYYSLLADPPENRSLYAVDWQMGVVPTYDGQDLTVSAPSSPTPGAEIEPAVKLGIKLSF